MGADAKATQVDSGFVPNDRGFDEFRGFLGGAHPYWITKRRSKILHDREPDHTSKGHATELFTAWAEEFIRENAADSATTENFPDETPGRQSFGVDTRAGILTNGKRSDIPFPDPAADFATDIEIDR